MQPTILHIGMPKTGTTYLQNWLVENNRLLKRVARLLVFKSPHLVAMDAIQNASRESLNDFSSNRTDAKRAVTNEAFAAATRFDGTTIMSSEYFFLADPDVVRRTLAERGFNVVSVICYLRRQDIVSSSGYAQDVKALGEKRVIGGHPYDPAMDYSVLYDRWAAAFPQAELLFRNYERAKSDLLQSFKTLAGIKVTGIEPATDDQAANISFNAMLTEAARLCNERGHPINTDGMLHFQARNPGPQFSFNPLLTGQFEQAYRPGNAALASRFSNGEFDEFSVEGWTQYGRDMTGHLGDDDLQKILDHCRRYNALRPLHMIAAATRKLARHCRHRFAQMSQFRSRLRHLKLDVSA